MKRDSETECRACNKPMRPQRSRAEDYPGKVARSGRGMCTTCYRQARKGVFPALPEPTHLTQYFARRRRLGVPAEGIHYPGEN